MLSLTSLRFSKLHLYIYLYRVRIDFFFFCKNEKRRSTYRGGECWSQESGCSIFSPLDSPPNESHIARSVQ